MSASKPTDRTTAGAHSATVGAAQPIAPGAQPGIDFPVWPDDIAAGYRAAGYWTGQSLGELLRARAAEHPEREAVVGTSPAPAGPSAGGPAAAAGNAGPAARSEQRWSYAELDRRADELARGLAAVGIGAGERIVVQLPNEPAFVEVLFGCLRLGAVPIMALPAHRATELTHFARHAEAAAVITCGVRGGFDHAALAAQVRAACPSVRVVITDEPRPQADHTLSQVRLASGPTHTHPPLAHQPRGGDLALLQLSGGTTGLSKLIPRTHDDYLYSVRVSAQVCEMGPQSRYLVALPAAHNFPLSSPGLLGTLWAGGTAVLCPSPDPHTALELIERERITITGIVPPLALAWMKALPTSGRSVSSLELLQVGGAKLDGHTAARVEPELGCRLQQVFGMAEGLVNYTRREDSAELVAATQGRPMAPADEVRVVDGRDQDVVPGEIGALLTRGPYTVRGYYRAAEHNRTAFTEDGFYRTGDLVSQRPSGHLEVVGREKEQINRGGEKIAPSEIEYYLLAHPAVLDACVVGLPDPVLGERTCAVIVARGEEPSAASLRRFVRERGVAAFKVPDRVAFLPEFPTTGAGKTSRRELRTELTRQLTDPNSRN